MVGSSLKTLNFYDHKFTPYITKKLFSGDKIIVTNTKIVTKAYVFVTTFKLVTNDDASQPKSLYRDKSFVTKRKSSQKVFICGDDFHLRHVKDALE